MTVAELIDELSELENQDMDVCILVNDISPGKDDQHLVVSPVLEEIIAIETNCQQTGLGERDYLLLMSKSQV